MMMIMMVVVVMVVVVVVVVVIVTVGRNPTDSGLQDKINEEDADDE